MVKAIILASVFLVGCVELEATTPCGFLKIQSFASDFNADEFRMQMNKYCGHSIGSINPQVNESNGAEAITEGVTEGAIKALTR